MVGCEPVPKAWPGSTTRSIAPGRGSLQGGRTQIRSPTSAGSWKARQRSAQSSGTGSPRTATRTPPTSASPAGKAGSSPGAP